MRSILKKTIPVKENEKRLTHIKVDYWFKDKRLILSLYPTRIEERPDGITIESFFGFSGKSLVIGTFQRYSSKVEKAAEEYKDEDNLIQAVANDHGLELV